MDDQSYFAGLLIPSKSQHNQCSSRRHPPPTPPVSTRARRIAFQLPNNYDYAPVQSDARKGATHSMRRTAGARATLKLMPSGRSREPNQSRTSAP